MEGAYRGYIKAQGEHLRYLETRVEVSVIAMQCSLGGSEGFEEASAGFVRNYVKTFTSVMLDIWTMTNED
ncbi:hypothetical protein AMTR_s00058p00115290 [Amborella trichopoda]|uniref:Uncharacterized protein n=1 Tax=Amborella trichopoda TaxID=13333 RepID=W1PHF3_AMBTC|nr:hypothetical protein AMTR_s00058p00115290 [Amborella trichopoda]